MSPHVFATSGDRSAAGGSYRRTSDAELFCEPRTKLEEGPSLRVHLPGPRSKIEDGSTCLAGAVAVPRAVLVELNACRVVLVERAVDLAGAIRRHTGNHAHILHRRDRKKQSVEFRASGSPAFSPIAERLSRRIVDAVHKSVDVVSARRRELDQFDWCRRRVLVIPRRRWPQDSRGVDRGEIATESVSDPSIDPLELWDSDWR
jgi:hypothetical protein